MKTYYIDRGNMRFYVSRDRMCNQYHCNHRREFRWFLESRHGSEHEFHGDFARLKDAREYIATLQVA